MIDITEIFLYLFLGTFSGILAGLFGIGGGIIIIPEKVELWKSLEDYQTRLHDRILFTLLNDKWTKSRLYP